MVDLRLGGVGLDCSDPAELGAFWSALLDGEVIHRSESLVIVRLGDLYLNAYRVEDHNPPSWPESLVPKQAHLDVAVSDLKGAAERASSLGATRADWQPDPESYVVMLDPAGHPFCLSTQFEG
jgi:hypothetical protein